MMLTSTASVDLVNISMPNAAIVAILGYAVVFFGLILLMCVVMAMGKIFIAKDKKAAEKAAAAKNGIDAVPVAPHTKGEIVLPERQPAPGTAGQLKLYDTDPKTAAMIMAIVANKMGKPLNELRFISIKEVK
ncbi:MAG: OadG family protein [Oscillospiraceae bacterium]|nr:OadG family protein [Oscillospiraceae bacterium]